MSSPTTTCDFPACKCFPGADTVARNGNTFCSARCADGRGCDHEHCNCGSFPAEEPSDDSARG